MRDAPDINGNFWLFTFGGAFINDDFSFVVVITLICVLSILVTSKIKINE